MGSPKAPPASESTDAMLNAYVKYLPQLMQATNSQVLPTAQAQLATAQQISPEQNALMLELYKTFGPQLAQVGSQIDTSNRIAAANTDVGLLQDQGAKLADAYSKIDRSLNPEYYATRAAASDKLGQILGATDLNHPDIEAERLINQENARSGNIAVPSATTTLANALSFGTARQNRVNNLANAISTATQFLQPSQNTQFNPATATLNKPTSNTGQSNFAGVSNAGQEAYGSGQNFLNQIGQNQQTAMNINANRRDVLDRLNETTTSIGSLVGGA